MCVCVGVCCAKAVSLCLDGIGEVASRAPAIDDGTTLAGGRSQWQASLSHAPHTDARPRHDPIKQRRSISREGCFLQSSRLPLLRCHLYPVTHLARYLATYQS